MNPYKKVFETLLVHQKTGFDFHLTNQGLFSRNRAEFRPRSLLTNPLDGLFGVSPTEKPWWPTPPPPALPLRILPLRIGAPDSWGRSNSIGLKSRPKISQRIAPKIYLYEKYTASIKNVQ